MTAHLLRLGRMEYAACTDLQRRVLEAVAAGERPPTLILVEHDPVLTLGADFHDEHLLLDAQGYAERGIALHRTDRGGDVTYHGPGQLVLYPVFRVSDFYKDLHRYLRDLEEAVIRGIAEWNLEGVRFPPHTGVWVEGRKLAAIGIRVRRWTSMHGIALNCSNDLAAFDTIVPCGIRDYGVTSLTELVGRPVGIEDAEGPLVRGFESVFGMRFEEQAS